MSDDETFETNESGASDTIPTPCSDVKKGGYCMLKGQPCKVVELTTAKTGKHGAAKASITGVNIFTDKKVEESISTSHSVGVPIVVRTEYSLIDIADDGFVTLMKEDGSTKEDLKLPTDEESKEMVEKIKADFAAGKDLIIGAIAACGQEKIVAFRETNN